MPVYEYACTECGEQLEVRQSFTDDALTVCPVCAGRLRKVLSAVGVVFKGSGFYKTDSRKASTATDAPAKTEKSDKGGGEKKADAPAAKSESSTPSAAKPAATASTSS